MLETALRTVPVVIVSGARQTGKTTLARYAACCKNRKFFSFDDLDILEQGKRSPESLLKEYPVTIDEVQRCPEFLLAVKRKVDEMRTNGMILLTGSANLALLKNVSETLAGRAIYIDQPPFCHSEWANNKAVFNLLESFFSPEDVDTDIKTSLQDWVHLFLTGGYPPVMMLKGFLERSLWHNGYIKTYLERDLRLLSEISNLIDFQRLMRIVALRTGRLMNQSEVARDAKITQPTCHRYLNLLEAGYQLVRLKNITLNRSQGLIKANKVMWSDSGICAALANMHSENDVTNRSDVGFWLEQHVYQTLQAWKAAHHNVTINFWYKEPLEVDFVLAKENRAVAIEVKLSSQVHADDLAGIKAFKHAFRNLYESTRGIVFYNGPSRYLGDNIYAISLNALV